MQWLLTVAVVELRPRGLARPVDEAAQHGEHGHLVVHRHVHRAQQVHRGPPVRVHREQVGTFAAEQRERLREPRHLLRQRRRGRRRGGFQQGLQRGARVVHRGFSRVVLGVDVEGAAVQNRVQHFLVDAGGGGGGEVGGT